MTDTVIKISCFAIIIGMALTLLKEGALKNYAAVGLGTVFTVCLVTSVLSLLGGADAIIQSGGLSAALSGKLKNVITLTELKAESQRAEGNEVIENYKKRLSFELEEVIKRDVGLESQVTFLVCEDMSSSDLGKVLHVHCKLYDPENGIIHVPEKDDLKDHKIDKIEIRPDGIYVNGMPVNEKDREEAEEENKNAAVYEARRQSEEKTYEAIKVFCGAEREICSIFWEDVNEEQ